MHALKKKTFIEHLLDPETRQSAQNTKISKSQSLLLEPHLLEDEKELSLENYITL